MRCAEGGKIDTVVYNASCGALSCTAKAGTGATIGMKPANAKAAQNARVLPRLPDRSRRFASPMLRRTSSQKITRKLSQRFRNAKAGGVIAQGKPGAGSQK